MYLKSIAALCVVASASAFAPAGSFGVRSSTKLFFEYGKYNDQMWDSDAKKDVYGSWDPTAARSTTNFNPYETFGGNSPDCSGIYPGESRYKDPSRPDVSFAIMMEERAYMEALEQKAGDAPGAAGCKN